MTTINTEAFMRIEADETGFSVTCTSSDSTLEVALNADERRALANALTPGCDFSGVDWKAMFEHEIRNRVAAVALLRRERDEALRKKGEAFDRAVRAECERDEWKARAEAAEARTAPAVTVEQRNVVADHLWEAMVGSAKSVVRDVVAQAFAAAGIETGIEAEQPVDPVEEQTDALADILYGDELVTDQMRGVLERVVRAGMLVPEQEASSDEPHAPATEDFRQRWLEAHRVPASLGSEQIGHLRQQRLAEFDVWLAKVKADARDAARHTHGGHAVNDMDRVRAVLDHLADQTEPPCNHATWVYAYREAVDAISRIAYPEDKP